jgi:hypothetical protein
MSSGRDLWELVRVVCRVRVAIVLPRSIFVQLIQFCSGNYDLIVEYDCVLYKRGDQCVVAETHTRLTDDTKTCMVQNSEVQIQLASCKC